MTWNKAAMQWANYRTPKPRVMHGPRVSDNTEWAAAVASSAGSLDMNGEPGHCEGCGYHVCHCAPKPSNAELCAAANARALLAEQAALEQHIQYLRRVKAWKGAK